MQQRRGSSSQWSDINPVLAAGEIGFEVDTLRFKVGDGTNDWESLPYFQNSQDIENIVSSVVGLAPEDLDTLKELSDAINNDPNFFNTISNAIDLKAPLDSPSFTGTVDFSEAIVEGLDILPDLEGNQGKFLSNDGTDLLWQEIEIPEIPEIPNVLNDLTDVSISSPSSGESLVYNGTSWSNSIIESGSTATGQNFIINGDFSIWERGNFFAFTDAGSKYTSDRWLVDVTNYTGEVYVTDYEFTPPTLAIPGYGQIANAIRLEINTSNTSLSLEQRIEGVKTLAGQSVTLSFWARRDGTPSYNIVPKLIQNFGTGGSSPVTVTGTSVSITKSNWGDRIVQTLTLPNIAEKTISGSGDDYLSIVLEMNNLEQSIKPSIWGVKLEAGTSATDFSLCGGGSGAAELALCQRYFYIPYTADSLVNIPAIRTSATKAEITATLPVEMRKLPNLIVSGSSPYGRVAYLSSNFENLTQDVSSIDISGSQHNFSNILISLTHTSITASGIQAFAYQTAGMSSPIWLDAEL